MMECWQVLGGPPLWHVLHTISFNYPVNPNNDQKKRYYNFFKGLQYILPCGKCRKNLVSNFKKTKFSKEVYVSRDKLSKWVYDLHNHINYMLGKSCSLTFEEVRNTYENFRARCTTEKKSLKCRKKEDG